MPPSVHLWPSDPKNK